MGEENSLTILLLWIPQAIAQLANLIYWWQVKEYRFDRFIAWSTNKSAPSSLGGREYILKSVVFLISFLTQQAALLTFLFLLLDIKLLTNIVRRNVRKPVFTLRASELLITGVFLTLLVTILIFGAFADIQITLGLGEILILLAPILGIIWTTPLVLLTKANQLNKAKVLLCKVKPSVIGITGSYGKTTTKEFTSHLLSTKYKVAKTEKSENTDLGIAKNILENLKKDTQIFVAELGAYKKGEIEKLAKILKPEVGVITGIEPQHAALFGNIENIKKAKYELIQNLAENGASAAIFNYSNSYCSQMAKQARKDGLNVLGYTVAKGAKANTVDATSHILSLSPNGINFEITIGKEEKKFTVKLPGAHFIENLTAAILIARYFKVSWSQISRGIKTLPLPERTMDTHKAGSGIIIDDSFNSTPTGFKAALRYLKVWTGKKKAVVTPGIIELGEYSDRIHKEIGQLAQNITSAFILTNDDFEKPIRSGLGNKGRKLEVITTTENLGKKVESMINEGYVVLLEGRIPASLVKLMKQYA